MAITHPGRHVDFSRVDHDDIGMDGITPLRYEIYCLECGFPDPDDYPDRRAEVVKSNETVGIGNL
jgi:hypothetical protein